MLFKEMIVVGSNYWNIVYGRDPGDVLNDSEGMENMRNLGQNMAWLLHCIEAGRKAGITPPAVEPWQPTNFIR